MKNNTSLVDEFADKSVDTDIDSQQHTQRERKLQNWNEEQARGIAKEEGVELTDAHF
jgi:sulfur relay (sulfurtransferase) DsrC/TusE family protein